MHQRVPAFTAASAIALLIAVLSVNVTRAANDSQPAAKHAVATRDERDALCLDSIWWMESRAIRHHDARIYHIMLRTEGFYIDRLSEDARGRGKMFIPTMIRTQHQVLISFPKKERTHFASACLKKFVTILSGWSVAIQHTEMSEK